jgi:hypothetical protein
MTESMSLTHAEIRDRITPPGAFNADPREYQRDKRGPRKVLVVETIADTVRF